MDTEKPLMSKNKMLVTAWLEELQAISKHR